MKQKTDTKRKSDAFEDVAKRLECDPDLKAFDAKLKKMAKPQATNRGPRSK